MISSSIKIQGIEQLRGICHPQFRPLAQAFEKCFSQLNETGAALCVYHRGELVVDLYGSHRSINGLWRANDRVCTMSASKGPLALCVHILAEKQQLSLSDKVSKYWPEFAQNGKEDVRISQLLNHSAGLPIIGNCRSGDIFNWCAMTRAIEEAPLIFPAGERMVYHALTFGHLVGELIRRVDGRMPSDFFHQEISQPFDIDYDLRHIDHQPTRDINDDGQFSRLSLWLCSKLVPLIPHWKMQYFRPCDHHYHPNSPKWKNCEFPAVSGQGSAKGLAKLYAFLANGGELNGKRLCQESTVKQIVQNSMKAQEVTTKQLWHMGAGFMINSPELVSFGSSVNSFGHMGMGGAVGFADPENQLAFAYVTEKYHKPNKQDKSMSGQRLQSLITASYQCL